MKLHAIVQLSFMCEAITLGYYLWWGGFLSKRLSFLFLSESAHSEHSSNTTVHSLCSEHVVTLPLQRYTATE